MHWAFQSLHLLLPSSICDCKRILQSTVLQSLCEGSSYNLCTGWNTQHCNCHEFYPLKEKKKRNRNKWWLENYNQMPKKHAFAMEPVLTLQVKETGILFSIWSRCRYHCITQKLVKYDVPPDLSQGHPLVSQCWYLITEVITDVWKRLECKYTAK